jgi:AcrR family transcriptional regulator
VITAAQARGRAPARDRIFEGAVRGMAEQGASVSMAEIAAAAGVSKALLHYHYSDRAHLLADVVTRLSARILARERAAIGEPVSGSSHEAVATPNPVDALWAWVDTELHLGELRTLLELATVRETAVREAWAEAANHRRRGAARTVTEVFGRLGLTPRLPAALLGDTSIAFLDGLAMDSGSGRDSRMEFDLFWLALLSLGE